MQIQMSTDYSQNIISCTLTVFYLTKYRWSLIYDTLKIRVIPNNTDHERQSKTSSKIHFEELLIKHIANEKMTKKLYGKNLTRKMVLMEKFCFLRFDTIPL